MNFTITKVSNGYVLSIDKGFIQQPEKFVYGSINELLEEIRRKVA